MCGYIYVFFMQFVYMLKFNDISNGLISVHNNHMEDQTENEAITIQKRRKRYTLAHTINSRQMAAL